jgi:putative ABC transport system permease protein
VPLGAPFVTAGNLALADSHQAPGIRVGKRPDERGAHRAEDRRVCADPKRQRQNPGRNALLVAVGLLLLIACANVGSLILTRSTVRRHELAVRSALGAGRLRLIRQMLTESLTLSALGGAAGLGLCVALAKMFRTSLPPALIPTGEIRVDAGVLWFGLIVSIISGLLCGLAPALLVSRGDLRGSLSGWYRSVTGSGMDVRVRSWLVAGEASLTVTLLISAGLLVRSFIRLMDVEPGFKPQHMLVVRFALPQFLHPSPPTRMSFYRVVPPRIPRS